MRNKIVLGLLNPVEISGVSKKHFILSFYLSVCCNPSILDYNIKSDKVKFRVNLLLKSESI